MAKEASGTPTKKMNKNQALDKLGPAEKISRDSLSFSSYVVHGKWLYLCKILALAEKVKQEKMLRIIISGQKPSF